MVKADLDHPALEKVPFYEARLIHRKDIHMASVHSAGQFQRYCKQLRWHLSIDNNSAERAIKNFAVGRRNWLFAKSIRGADASAVVYSIAETALLNGRLEPMFCFKLSHHSGEN